MSELVRVAVDAMGGDHAPEAVVQGVVDALNASKEIEVLLVGDQTAIEKCLTGAQYDKTRLQVIHASEVITNNETPTIAIKKKKDSSIVVSQRLVREGKADAFVSAGSTGAVLVGSQVLIGRIRGIDRLWCQCGCQAFQSCAVCKNGCHLYGTYLGPQESPGSHCEYWY